MKKDLVLVLPEAKNVQLKGDKSSPWNRYWSGSKYYGPTYHELDCRWVNGKRQDLKWRAQFITVARKVVRAAGMRHCSRCKTN